MLITMFTRHGDSVLELWILYPQGILNNPVKFR